MPRILLAQLLLLGLGLGPRGAAAKRTNAKAAPAQLHTSSASQDLGRECPLATLWQEKCYNLLGSPLEERDGNDCQHKTLELELSDGEVMKVKCKVAYVCTDHAKTKEIPGHGGKDFGWTLQHCHGISGTVTRKVCMAPPENERVDVCASEPKPEEDETVKKLEETTKQAPWRQEYECRCTSSTDAVDAVWIKKRLLDQSSWNILNKLWAGGGIANLDNDQRCACIASNSWFSSDGCSLSNVAVYSPTGYWPGDWSEWQAECTNKCNQADARVDNFCGELA